MVVMMNASVECKTAQGDVKTEMKTGRRAE